MNKDFSRIISHLYGELSPEEEKLLTADAATRPDLAKEISDLRQLITAYRLAPQAEPPQAGEILTELGLGAAAPARADGEPHRQREPEIAAADERPEVTPDLPTESASIEPTPLENFENSAPEKTAANPVAEAPADAIILAPAPENATPAQPETAELSPAQPETADMSPAQLESAPLMQPETTDNISPDAPAPAVGEKIHTPPEKPDGETVAKAAPETSPETPEESPAVNDKPEKSARAATPAPQPLPADNVTPAALPPAETIKESGKSPWLRRAGIAAAAVVGIYLFDGSITYHSDFPQPPHPLIPRIIWGMVTAPRPETPRPGISEKPLPANELTPETIPQPAAAKPQPADNPAVPEKTLTAEKLADTEKTPPAAAAQTTPAKTTEVSARAVPPKPSEAIGDEKSQLQDSSALAPHEQTPALPPEVEEGITIKIPAIPSPEEFLVETDSVAAGKIPPAVSNPETAAPVVPAKPLPQLAQAVAAHENRQQPLTDEPPAGNVPQVIPGDDDDKVLAALPRPGATAAELLPDSDAEKIPAAVTDAPVAAAEPADNAPEFLRKAQKQVAEDKIMSALFTLDEEEIGKLPPSDQAPAWALKGRLEMRLNRWQDMQATINRLEKISPLDARALGKLRALAMALAQTPVVEQKPQDAPQLPPPGTVSAPKADPATADMDPVEPTPTPIFTVNDEYFYVAPAPAAARGFHRFSTDPYERNK